ncbi:hypothetical protein [Gallaecimonas pentaromativorans]|uniref:hypothetical protein n=1 Tax=Gallaecimonas pentaromativorans TaxID=584787 RepID=UPI003A91D6D2
MAINATLLGQFLAVFVLVMGVLCYWVARGKVKNPVVAGILGAIASVLPAAGLVYLAILLFKKELPRAEAAQ